MHLLYDVNIIHFVDKLRGGGIYLLKVEVRFINEKERYISSGGYCINIDAV